MTWRGPGISKKKSTCCSKPAPRRNKTGTCKLMVTEIKLVKELKGNALRTPSRLEGHAGYQHWRIDHLQFELFREIAKNRIIIFSMDCGIGLGTNLLSTHTRRYTSRTNWIHSRVLRCRFGFAFAFAWAHVPPFGIWRTFGKTILRTYLEIYIFDGLH